VDLFDDYCEHLLVRDLATQQVVGTYRVLTPAQARRVGSTYSDTEFDLTRLRSLRERMVELGRSCVHPEHRHGGVILALWGALAEFMVRNQLDTMIGCASIPMLHNGVVSGDAAASIWRQVSQTHLAPIDFHVRPRLPLPIEQAGRHAGCRAARADQGLPAPGRQGAGPPAWDPDFNTADLPMMMRIADLPARYRKHFLGA
jgi:putative hemolysin